MKLLSIAAAVAFAFALVPSIGHAEQAKAKAKAAAPTTQTCKYKLSTGKVKTWTCGKEQICCASEQFGLFTCGSQLLQCF